MFRFSAGVEMQNSPDATRSPSRLFATKRAPHPWQRDIAFAILMLALWPLVSGCGGGGGSTVIPFPQPFNTPKGEGSLVSQTLVVTYPTATVGGVPGLNTLYLQGICAGLSTSQCAANQANLNTPQFGNFNLAADPIGNNALGIEGIDAVKIDYTAIGVDQSATTASGGVLIPKVAPASLKGLILYFHATAVQRSAVPSSFTIVGGKTNLDNEGILLAALWASQGYVVVMPDYLGLGDDRTHPHPYVLYPSADAQSGLAMVSAARSVLAASYGITGGLPLFITGYSEGGAYALQSERMMQENPLYGVALNMILKKAVPLSGAFDLAGTMLPYLFDNVTVAHNDWFSLDPTETGLVKPFLVAYLATAFASYSGISPTGILAGPFYNCAKASVCVGSANLTDLYFNSTLANGDLVGAGDLIALVAFNQAALTGYGTANNSIARLLTPAYAAALMSMDKTNPLFKQASEANTYQFVPSVPVTLTSLEMDSVVTRKNTDVAFAFFEKQNPKGPYKEELVANAAFTAQTLSGTGPVDHVTELPFMSVLILNEFNTTP